MAMACSDDERVTLPLSSKCSCCDERCRLHQPHLQQGRSHPICSRTHPTLHDRVFTMYPGSAERMICPPLASIAVCYYSAQSNQAESCFISLQLTSLLFWQLACPAPSHPVVVQGLSAAVFALQAALWLQGATALT